MLLLLQLLQLQLGQMLLTDGQALREAARCGVLRMLVLPKPGGVLAGTAAAHWAGSMTWQQQGIPGGHRY